MDSMNCFSPITGNTPLPGNSFYMLELFHLEVLNSSQTLVSKRGICCFILVKGPWVHFQSSHNVTKELSQEELDTGQANSGCPSVSSICYKNTMNKTGV